MNTGADTSAVRRWNERHTLAVLRDGLPQRVATLAGHTGLTAPAMRDVLRTLADKGWVRRVAASLGGRGRPAQEFQLTPVAGRVLGIDIGGHTVRAIIRDDAGTILHRREVRVGKPGSLTATRRAVTDCLDGVADESLLATGVALSGRVSEAGVLVRSIATPHLEGRDPRDFLADILSGRMFIHHDIHASLWAEVHDGAAVGERDVMLLQLGRRPGVALLLDGKLHRGAHGAAGEFSLNELLGAIDPSDPAGFRDLWPTLAPTIALAVSLTDPAVLVLGGGLSPALAPLLPQLERALSSQVEVMPRLVTTALDQFAPATGAHSLALGTIWAETVETPEGVLQHPAAVVG